MATNPMQRKSRNSFLLGMLVMLLISGLIIAFLFLQLMEKSKKEREAKLATVEICVLNQDVKSGQIITSDMLVKQYVNRNFIPANATTDINSIEKFALKDKEGNNIVTKNKTVEGKTVPTLYIQKYDNEYEIKQETETFNYYIERNGQKEYLELNSVPLIAKIDMNRNTVITTSLISKGDNILQDDMRKQEYNMIVLPMDITTGDYVDIRVMFPNGQDFIVVSKKEVEVPNIGGIDSEDTIWVNLSEDEILHMSCAIVDAAQVKGAKIYATRYTEAGMQVAATPTFPVNSSTSALLQTDPNILGKAMTEIRNRYANGNSAEIRNSHINPEIEKQGDDAKSNLEEKMQESITNSKNSRKEYLESLMSVTPTTTGTTPTN